eukprot:PhF_6_TR42690/c1_g1_i1/m.64415
MRPQQHQPYSVCSQQNAPFFVGSKNTAATKRGIQHHCQAMVRGSQGIPKNRPHTVLFRVFLCARLDAWDHCDVVYVRHEWEIRWSGSSGFVVELSQQHFTATKPRSWDNHVHNRKRRDADRNLAWSKRLEQRPPSCCQFFRGAHSRKCHSCDHLG